MRRTKLLSWLMLIVWVLSACIPSANPTPTATAGELWPPTVVDVQPTQGQEATVDTSITIRFDQPMDRRRTEAALSIEPDLSGTFLWPDVRTMVFRPRTALQEATTYRVHLKESARSLEGATLLRPLDFSFSTVAPLQVAQILPQDGASGLRVDSPVRISFNQAIVPESCIGQTAGNRNECPTLPVSVDPPVLTRGMWLSPALYQFMAYPGWNAGTRYRITLRGAIQALNGNRITVDHTSGFTTAQVEVVRVEPLDQQTAELSPETRLRIVFNNPMDPKSTAEAFSLTSQDGASVPGTLTWNEDRTALTFTPLRPLRLATRYTSRLTQRARAITTAPLIREQAWSFNTVSAAAVNVVYPPNGTRDVPLQSSARFALQGSWDEATLRAGVIVSPTAQNLQMHLQGDSLALTWERAPRTTYCVTFPAGLRDRYDQELQQKTETCFTTAGLDARFEPAISDKTLVIDAAAVARLSFLARNVTRMDFQLYRVDEQTFMTDAPVSGNPLRDWVERFTLPADTLQVVTIDVMRGNPLRSGYYRLQWTDPATNDLRQIRLAVVDRHLNVQLGREEAQVWVSDLRSTTPITGVQVRLLERGVLLAAGTSNAEGLVQLRFEPRAEIYSPLFVVTGEPGAPGFGLVATSWHQYTAPWDFALSAQYDRFPTEVIWGITDRQAYYPLETIHLAGMVRQRNGVLYEYPSGSRRLGVVLEDPQHTIVYSNTIILNDQGFFSADVTLPYNLSPGLYQLSLTRPDALAHWESTVRILATAQQDPLSLDILLPQPELPLYIPVTITVLAATSTGLPLTQATGLWEVWRDNTLLASAPLTLDALGRASFTLPRPATWPQTPETWLLRVTLPRPRPDLRSGTPDHRSSSQPLSRTPPGLLRYSHAPGGKRGRAGRGPGRQTGCGRSSHRNPDPTPLAGALRPHPRAECRVAGGRS